MNISTKSKKKYLLDNTNQKSLTLIGLGQYEKLNYLHGLIHSKTFRLTTGI